MARVRLYLDHPRVPHEYRFVRPDGTTGVIPGLRLRAFVNLTRYVSPGPDAVREAFPDCVLDTGAYLTTIPEAIWRPLRPGAFVRLPFAPSMPQIHRAVSVAGGTFPYDLGEITLPLEDRAGGRLAVTVVAKFTRDGGRLTSPLTLGLRGGVLDGRVLRADPDPATPFGQAWALEDP